MLAIVNGKLVFPDELRRGVVGSNLPGRAANILLVDEDFQVRKVLLLGVTVC